MDDLSVMVGARPIRFCLITKYVFIFRNGLFSNMIMNYFLSQLDSRWLKKMCTLNISCLKRKQFMLRNVSYRLFHLQCL